MASKDGWAYLVGTQAGKYKLGIGGVLLKNASAVLEVRNSADSAYSSAKATKFSATLVAGIELNANAAGSGSDWKGTIQQDTLSAARTWTLPDSSGLLDKTAAVGTFPGGFQAVVGAARWYPPFAVTFITLKVWTSANVPVAVTVAVRKNGTVADTLTISSGASTASKTVSITLATTDYITFDVQSGSGNDLVMRLET